MPLSNVHVGGATALQAVLLGHGAAVALCVVTMLCWGSWANTQKLAGQSWPFQLFYWDYAVGVLLFALMLAFTAGSVGSAGRPFLADLAQAESGPLWSAILGGIGSPVGAVVAGLILGVAQEVSTPFVGLTYKIALAFVIMLAVLLIRPRGLFGRVESVR